MLTPATAIDGMTGQVRWTYISPPQWWRSPAHGLLDPGKSTRLPLLISTNQPMTVGRHALPTTSSGDYLPPAGSLVPPGLTWNDPRWTRPIPWVTLVVREVGTRGFLALAGLALVNVIVPVTLLRLTARRGWRVSSLMALPIAAAVPLSVLQVVEPLMPGQFGPLAASARLVFLFGTLAGIPIAVYAIVAAWSLVQRRWKRLFVLATATAFAAAAVAAVWLWIDLRSMPAIEHYDRSTWYLVLIPGAYCLGILIPLGWILRRLKGWLRGLSRAET